MEQKDLLDQVIDRIAEAVVRKIDERQKIDLIAEAVLERLAQQEQAPPAAAKAEPTRQPRQPAKKAKRSRQHSRTASRKP